MYQKKFQVYEKKNKKIGHFTRNKVLILGELSHKSTTRFYAEKKIKIKQLLKRGHFLQLCIVPSLELTVSCKFFSKSRY